MIPRAEVIFIKIIRFLMLRRASVGLMKARIELSIIKLLAERPCMGFDLRGI